MLRTKLAKNMGRVNHKGDKVKILLITRQKTITKYCMVINFHILLTENPNYVRMTVLVTYRRT